jgi:hypothetical protein
MNTYYECVYTVVALEKKLRKGRERKRDFEEEKGGNQMLLYWRERASDIPHDVR